VFWLLPAQEGLDDAHVAAARPSRSRIIISIDGNVPRSPIPPYGYLEEGQRAATRMFVKCRTTEVSDDHVVVGQPGLEDIRSAYAETLLRACSTATKTLARPSRIVIVCVMSVPHISLTLSVMIVPSCGLVSVRPT
jgi:hypothetical protein